MPPKETPSKVRKRAPRPGEGRPVAVIDEERLDALCKVPSNILTNDEIAWLIGSAHTTLERFIKEKHKVSFGAYRDQKRANVRKNLWAKQYELAMKGNVTCLIWLGKQELGQRDQPPKDAATGLIEVEEIILPQHGTKIKITKS